MMEIRWFIGSAADFWGRGTGTGFTSNPATPTMSPIIQKKISG